MQQRILIVCASSLIAAGLISCASDNSPKPSPMPKIKNYDTLKVGWEQTKLMDSQAGSFIPINYDNAVFAADSGGYIYKLDPSDGSLINYFYIRRDLSSGVGISGSYIFVTTKDAYLLAIDKGNGKIRWRAALPTISLEAPQVADDIVLVRTNDAQLLAYGVNDGKPLWVYQRPTPPLTLRVSDSFQTVGSEVVAVGMPGGKLVLLNLHTGVPIWENYIAVPKGATDLDKITDISMRPLVDGRVICVAAYNGRIACLDAVSSNIIWDKKFSTSQGMTFDQQNIYAVSQDGVVYAFDKATGAQIWQNKTLQYRKLGMPAILGNDILIVDKDGYAHLFNRNDGQETARLQTKLYDGVSYPLVRDNGIVLQSANGTVALLKNY